MKKGGVFYIRLALAFAVGVGIDLILFADGYPYDVRYRHQSLIGISIYWLGPMITLLCSFVLDFKEPRSYGGAPDSRWIVDLDSFGLLIPSVVVIGQTITHTLC